MHENLKLKYKILLWIPMVMFLGGFVFIMPSVRLMFDVKAMLGGGIAFEGGNLVFYFFALPFAIFFIPVLLAFCGYLFVYYFYKKGSEIDFFELFKLLEDNVYPDKWMEERGSSDRPKY